MAAARRRNLTRIRVLALVLAAALAAVGLFGARNDFTEATWTSTEYANAPLTTGLISPPVITSCVTSSGALGINPAVTIVWHFPTGSGYVVPANIVYWFSYSNLLSGLVVVTLANGITTTGPVTGNYTTVYSGGLLSGLLGASVIVGLQSSASGWTSTVATATASMGALGVNPQCTIQ